MAQRRSRQGAGRKEEGCSTNEPGGGVFLESGGGLWGQRLPQAKECQSLGGPPMGPRQLPGGASESRRRMPAAPLRNGPVVVSVEPSCGSRALVSIGQCQT